ncbi:hypothetical protein HG536_0E03790 [Torulaspora globosa]|uniref:Rab-GAP TBC domain-containing protein n=1 Tax=Torulaspora globosa TaxID=48254 RepID=A0A7G3ZIY2_9SACH|nr:uncharacterized protein HG536_0E03790 [Torulaspora globosa]QLL33468.1 hypothetical protein HG536_0E03790 [Torulaspora globosa]
MDLKQLTIDKYETREKLVLSGIWGGEIYKTANLAAGNGRGWLWKTLVIDGDADVEEPVEVPSLEHNVEGSSQGRKPRVRKQKSIRRLTPIDVARHPLRIPATDGEAGTGEDDRTCLQEKLEIIDLDLSRLMLHDIFQQDQVHSEMRQILYNYLLRNEEDSSYKQGYHELLGMIYLQLHTDEREDLGAGQRKMRLRNALCIFEKLMKHMTLFYNETRLIQWEEKEFRPILSTCCPRLYDIFCSDDNHTNLLWLIRWTRLLFMRELPRDYTLIIWDHLFTGLYPVHTLVACLIVVLLLNNYRLLVEEVEDHNDLVELMLHFQSRITSMVDCIELCKMAGNLCELWYTQDVDSMKLICDNFLKIKFNVDREPDREERIDPNRRRIEEKLRRRVKQTLLPKRKTLNK